MKKVAKNIIIDPKIRFGKPIIKGTRITIEEVLAILASGMGFEEIGKEYGLKREDITAAVQYANSFIKGEEIKQFTNIKYEICH